MTDKASLSIRPASPMDSVNIVRLIKAGYEDTPAAQISPMNEQAVLEYVTQTLKNAFAIVAEHVQSGRLVGTLAVAPIRMPWCGVVVMAESWFAAATHERGKKAPEQLLDVLDRFLDEKKMTAILGTQVLTPARFNDVLARRERHGYFPSRATFIRLPHHHTDEKGRPVMPPKAASA